MKRILIIAAFAFNLSACASLDSVTQVIRTTVQTAISPNTFDTVEAGYGATLSAAGAYRSLCERKVINKSCWQIIALLQPYELKAYNAYTVLKNYVKNNPNGDASSLINLAMDTINTFKSVQIQNGVK